MAIEVLMPRLGLTMEEGRIIEWKKKEGETVEKGEILLIIETEKVSYEFECPESGIIGKIFVTRDQIVLVGALLCVILEHSEALEEKYVKISTAEFTKAQEVGQITERKLGAVISHIDGASGRESVKKRIIASPLAKVRAKELGVDLSVVQGTGFGGRIEKRDVEHAAQTTVRISQATNEPKLIPLTLMRKTIAKRMAVSFQTIPHFYLMIEVDVGELEGLRGKLNTYLEKENKSRLTITDFLIKGTAIALRRNPMVNSRWTDEGVQMFRQIDIGVATSVEEGLIVPVIREAYNKSISQIAEAREDLTRRAKEGKLRLDEISGSTFTISNMGMFGVEQFIAIINPPESAILAVGQLFKKLEMLGGKIEERFKMKLTASFDHRVLDGASGAKFLADLKEIIGEPNVITL